MLFKKDKRVVLLRVMGATCIESKVVSRVNIECSLTLCRYFASFVSGMCIHVLVFEFAVIIQKKDLSEALLTRFFLFSLFLPGMKLQLSMWAYNVSKLLS